MRAFVSRYGPTPIRLLLALVCETFDVLVASRKQPVTTIVRLLLAAFPTDEDPD